MGIRINRISINRTGPLKEDFNFEPGNLNLIYGHNETGKTCVVEAMIEFLFKTKKHKWGETVLRPWDAVGKVIAGGVTDDGKTVTFKPGSKKLEDLFGKESGLPDDLSNLMVVRSGETKLSNNSDDSDGVGWDILKDCLSGEGVLDSVDDRIKLEALRKAEITNRVIIIDAGSKLIQNMKESKENLKSLHNLLDEVNSDNSATELVIVKKEHARLENNKTELYNAKCYHAGILGREFEEAKQKLKKLPSDAWIQEIHMQVNLYEANWKRKAKEEKDLENAAIDGDDCRYAEEAERTYSELLQRNTAVRSSNSILLIAALLLAVGTLALGFLKFPLPGAVTGILAILFFFLAWKSKNPVNPDIEAELRRIREGFKERFGKDIDSNVELRAVVSELKSKNDRAEEKRKNLNRVSLELKDKENSILRKMSEFHNETTVQSEWPDIIEEMRTSRKTISKSVSNLEKDILRLNINPAEYLNTYNGIVWNEIEYERVNAEMTEKTEKITETENQLSSLKTRMHDATGLDTDKDWNAHTDELRKKHSELQDEYREITAEVIAKILVHKAVKELRNEEMKNVRKGLKDKLVTDSLYALTSSYRSIHLDDDHTMTVVTELEDEYPLEMLSKGAKEQVYLALRTGFAQRIMKDPAFLILDDAFQHSDYKRRENLVDYTMKLVKAGWQIFYFTMDDHMGDLFQEAGKSLGAEFKRKDL